MNEEPFGPLAPILSFNDIDDAVDEANRLEYGLAAGVYTKILSLPKIWAQYRKRTNFYKSSWTRFG